MTAAATYVTSRHVGAVHDRRSGAHYLCGLTALCHRLWGICTNCNAITKYVPSSIAVIEMSGKGQKQTWAAHPRMSALCQKRTSVSGSGSGVPYYQNSILQ